MALAALPCCSFALGLGQITVRSALNQPFRAEIELTNIGTANLSQLRARIAPQTLAQLSQGPVGFAAVVETIDGRSFLQITSQRPIRDPLLSLVVDVRWPQGRLNREFAILLDPPEYIVSAPPRSGFSGVAPPSPRAQASTPPPPARPSEPPPPPPANLPEVDLTSTYRVARGDNLWTIANRVRPTGVSVEEMMGILVRENPQAFINGDRNRLLADVDLRVPVDPGFPTVDNVAEALPDDPLAPSTPAPRVRLEPPAPATPEPPAQGLVAADAELDPRFRIGLVDDHPRLQLSDFAAARQRLAQLNPPRDGGERDLGIPGTGQALTAVDPVDPVDPVDSSDRGTRAPAGADPLTADPLADIGAPAGGDDLAPEPAFSEDPGGETAIDNGLSDLAADPLAQPGEGQGAVADTTAPEPAPESAAVSELLEPGADVPPATSAELADTEGGLADAAPEVPLPGAAPHGVADDPLLVDPMAAGSTDTQDLGKEDLVDRAPPDSELAAVPPLDRLADNPNATPNPRLEAVGGLPDDFEPPVDLAAAPDPLTPSVDEPDTGLSAPPVTAVGRGPRRSHPWGARRVVLNRMAANWSPRPRAVAVGWPS
ncbi:MAG: FimV/HubP family polar landmark protein [Candidatus Competibacterales bacterium]